MKTLLALTVVSLVIVSQAFGGKMNKDELKKKLTPTQFEVMCNEATEPAFKNEYWDNKEPGIYVDRITGEPLFSSTDKFDSGTGWPSFTKPLESEAVTTKLDFKLILPRTEVKSKSSDAHLGHVFDDGPGPTKKRYCINSASLKFVALKDLEKEGLGKWVKLFDGAQSKVVDEAILAGGCFWGVEDLIRKLPGVIETEVGYVGGQSKNPTYNDVKKGTTQHAEAVLVKFDSSKLSYAALLDYFFKLHDPTTLNRQGNDIGTQYRSAIFAKDQQQKAEASKAIERANKSGRWKSPVVTTVNEWSTFWKAEDYHQDYLQKNPNGYTCHWIRE